MARLRPEHLTELRRLHGEATAVVGLLVERGELPDSGTALQAVFADLLAAQSLRGLRTAVRDLRGMLIALDPRTRGEFLAEAGRRAGHRITLGAEPDAAKAAAVVERGRIRNETEYFLLRASLDELEAEPGREGEAHRVAALLDSYGA
jgi:hypothetical protein